MDIKQLILYG